MEKCDQSQLNALAVHLHSEREHLLHSWRQLLQHDPELTTSSNLSRSALEDHVPTILGNLERRLRAEHTVRATEVDLQQRRSAADHAADRWERGYDLREALREWAHLQEVLLAELESYVRAHPDIDPVTTATARRVLTKLCMEGVCESGARYGHLLQGEANGRLRHLEQSLNTLQELENERAALLQQTAHDLRGGLGVMVNAAVLLTKPQVAETRRTEFHALLQRGIGSLGTMLAQLTELARIESKQDKLGLEVFDAAERLREACQLLRALTEERGLYLRCEGPPSLSVQSDPLKLQRILQNLLLNALRATEQGGVVVRWETLPPDRWRLSVEDTGRGFDPERMLPLQPSTDSSRSAPPRLAAAAGARGPPKAAAGEGIGLSIVKRLCQLLGAQLSVRSAAERGTTIQITFPLRYRSGT